MGSTISAYEFLQAFPDERSAIEFAESIRWPNVVVCPFCESGRTSRQKAYQYHQCKDCRKKFTVRTDTIFERFPHPPQQVALRHVHPPDGP